MNAPFNLNDQYLSDLKFAQHWLSDRTHWAKGCSWFDGEGERLAVGQEDVSKVAATCLMGALSYRRELRQPEEWWPTFCDSVSEAQNEYTRSWPFKKWNQSSIADFNDDTKTTHEDVLKLMDYLIHARTAQLMKAAVQ